MSKEEKILIDFLKKCKENKDKVIPLLQQSNENLLNYIDKLNNQLQQKENIIKEVREKLNTQLAFTSSYQLNYQSALSIIEQAKQILDKENKNESY